MLGFTTASTFTRSQFTRAQSTCTVMLAPEFWAPLCLHCPELEQLRAVMHAEARHPRAPPPSRELYAFTSPCSLFQPALYSRPPCLDTPPCRVPPLVLLQAQAVSGCELDLEHISGLMVTPPAKRRPPNVN